MTKLVVALILLAHGVGHSMGLLQVFKVAAVNPAWDGESWMLTRAVGPTLTQFTGVVIWSVAIIGFAAFAGVVMGWLPASWWTPLAIVSSVVSLVGIAFFPLAFPTFSTVGAVAVDVAVLFAVFALHWSPADLGA
jgi:hypothetical protein